MNRWWNAAALVAWLGGCTGPAATTAVDDNGASADKPAPPAQGPAATLDVVNRIAVGGEADWMGIGFDSLWAPTNQHLLRIDPKTGRVAKIAIGRGRYRGVAIGDDAVFVPNTGDDTISKVDPKTNQAVATFAVPLGKDSEGSIGVSGDALWVVTDPGAPDRDGVLSRLELTAGATVATIAVPADSHGVLYQDGSVWVTSAGGNSVTKIDPMSNSAAAPIAVDAGPRFLTGGGGAVWVLSQGTGKVTRISTSTGKVVAVIDVGAPGPGGDISFGEGGVWVATFGVPVIKIDPETNAVVARFAEDGFGDAIRAGLGYLWVSGDHIFQIKVP
jgi:streptogramin lyase